MATDFGIYPPEINSGRMYTGPGPGPMIAAMQAWDTLADELYTAASGYRSVVSELTEGAWSGPSSAAMRAAADHYVRWLSATAAHAEETATHARTAAAAYETAFVSTVPPPEIAANRSLLALLVATNFLGQNTPAIAATEALYAEMWAQDALAMYNYAGSSAAAVVLTPFTSPHQSTDPGAMASQAAAVSRIGDTLAGNVNGAISVVPQTLSAMAAPAPTDPLSTLSNLISVFLNAPTDLTTDFVIIPLDALSGPANIPINFFASAAGLECDDTFSGLGGVEPWPGTGPAPVTQFPATLTNSAPGTVPAPTMSAALGEANVVGGLTVPPGWTVAAPESPTIFAAPEVRAAAFTTPITTAPSAATTSLQIGAAMSGQALAGPPPTSAQDNPKPITHTRLPRPTTRTPTHDDLEASPTPRPIITGVVAAIRDIARQRAEGQLNDEEYNERKKHLLESSFGHPPK